jgi:hypothetical protein
MQHMLPPELREMVYDILLQDSEVPIFSADLNLNIDPQASDPEFRFPGTLLANFDYAHILLNRQPENCLKYVAAAFKVVH